MTITSCGPVCDVAGEYILIPFFGLGEMHSFSVSYSDSILHCCDEHRPILEQAGEHNDWKLLPPGPLRRGYEEAQAKLDKKELL